MPEFKGKGRIAIEETTQACFLRWKYGIPLQGI